MNENEYNTSSIPLFDVKEIKMNQLVVLFCYLLSLCFYGHLEAVLLTFKILSCTVDSR